MTTIKLRTLFMGTPDISVPALRVLAAKTDLRCVITQPDRPAGRGNTLTPPSVKVAAQQLGLPVWQPERLRDHEDDPRLQNFDLYVVMAFGQILRQKVLDLPTFGCVNLHASLLPRWRGASPLQAALRAGDQSTGISVMHMVRACDAGPVYAQHPLPVPSNGTLPWLHDQLAALAGVALQDFLDNWPPPPPLAQDQTLVTHCGKLDSASGQLLFSQTAHDLDRQIRAYTPAPGCWVLVKGNDDNRTSGQRLRIHAAHPEPSPTPVIPGQWYAHGQGLALGTADGLLVIDSLQSPGGKILTCADWRRGHGIPTPFTN